MNQLSRYAIIGIAGNLTGYVAYLLLTFLYVGPKLAMNLIYVIGALIGFYGDRRWTFAHKGCVIPVLMKYALTHIFGYSLIFPFSKHLSIRCHILSRLFRRLRSASLPGFYFLYSRKSFLFVSCIACQTC
jgi:putative flippase GtrA